MGIFSAGTQQRRAYTGSPVFRDSVPALTSNAVTVLDLAPENSSAARYAPFNFVQVINNGSQDVEVYLNQSDESVLYVPANTIQTVDSSTAPATRSIRVKNVGSGSTSANEVQIIYQKTVVTGESIIGGLARSIYGGRGV